MSEDNPLFNTNNYNPNPKRSKRVEPFKGDDKKSSDKSNHGAEQAVNLLRNKINSLYDNEPDAKVEMKEAEAAGKHRSKHQQFMHELSTSGKSLAEIQTAWHNYYVNLPNKEKHEVWQEFYTQHAEHTRTSTKRPTPTPGSTIHHTSPTQNPTHHSDPRSNRTIRANIRRNVRAQAKTKGKASHSLLFGLGMGVLVVLIMSFGLFNERFIAPFISPSRNVSNTSIIIDPTNTKAGPEPKIIIPKINVEIPVIFDEERVDEDSVQQALEDGVLHYATTSQPGEKGNGAIFGHSSNNILNRGKYKFAFVLLNRLENGDTFYVQKDSVRYAYRVYKKTVVTPTELSVLGAQEKPSTMSLITCDPPGTTINRLVVVGEQISPDPSTNVASSARANPVNTPEELPSDAPSLWSRIIGWLSS